jgi:hypothetical protein
MGESEQRFSSACSIPEKQLLCWATMCGSSPHPDQSLLLARLAQEIFDLWTRASSSILPFFIVGGVAPP